MRGVVRAGMLVVALLLCAATSVPHPPPKYPMLSTEGPRTLACASVRLWVSKSEKTELRIAMELRASAPGCVVTLTGARLVLPDGAVVDAERPQPITITTTEPEFRYLAFAFDATGWRRGESSPVLTLAAADGSEWAVPLTDLMARYDQQRNKHGGHR